MRNQRNAEPGAARLGPALVAGLWGLSLCLGLSVGCSSGGGAASGPGPVDGESRPAATLPIPDEAGRELPPGHPPLAGGTTLTWNVPRGWVEQPPASSMRVAQYVVSGPAGEGECVVYYFGPNQGGEPMANARRWAGQFTQPDGRDSVDVMRITDLESTRLPTKLVEITGTYDGGMTMTAEPAQPQPGSMLLGGIVEGPDAPWFFKLTGPEETLRAQRGAFMDLLDSVHVEGTD